MSIYTIYLKTHNKTKMKYLGFTSSKNPEKYKGSGIYWLRHIKEHGYDVATKILFQDKNLDIVKEKCKYFSDLYDIVNNPDFANLTEEQGWGGWSDDHREKAKNSISPERRRENCIKGGFKSKKMKLGRNDPKVYIEAGRKGGLANKGKPLSEEHKKKISKSLRKGFVTYVLYYGSEKYVIEDLNLFCKKNGLEYDKVFYYIDKGIIKYNKRYMSPTREWFIGKEIRRE